MILYKKNIKIGDQIVKKMIDEIKIDEFFSKKDNHYTTFFSNGKIKPENILNNFYNDILTDVSKEFGFYKVSKFYNSMWAQVYPPHFGKHSPHSHFYGSVLFSWVHFIKPTSNKCFSFLDSENNKTYPPQDEGDFIVFPSWKRHCVDVNISEDDRFVIAGNAISVNFNTNH